MPGQDIQEGFLEEGVSEMVSRTDRLDKGGRGGTQSASPQTLHLP